MYRAIKHTVPAERARSREPAVFRHAAEHADLLFKLPVLRKFHGTHSVRVRRRKILPGLFRKIELIHELVYVVRKSFRGVAFVPARLEYIGHGISQ